MSALSIQPTYPIFTDIDGQPLEAGYVWLGTANLDPQTNPITVYWDAELTILAPQPIRTLAGYPSNNGTPGRLYVNSDYSIRVMNKNGSVVYSAPAATERYSDVVVSGVNAEDVIYDPPFLGGVQTNVEAKLAQTVSVKDFGAVGDATTDDTAAFLAALTASDTVYVPAGNYKISATLPFNRHKIIGAGANVTSKGTTITMVANAPVFQFNGGYTEGCRISGMILFYGQSIPAAGTNRIGINIPNVSAWPSNFEFSDLWIIGAGIGINDTSGSYLGKHFQIRAENCRNGFIKTSGTTIVYEQCYVKNCLQSWFLADVFSVTLISCAFDGCNDALVNQPLFFASGVSGLVILGMDQEVNFVGRNLNSIMRIFSCYGFQFSGIKTFGNKLRASTGENYWMEFSGVSVGEVVACDSFQTGYDASGGGTVAYLAVVTGSAKVSFKGCNFPAIIQTTTPAFAISIGDVSTGPVTTETTTLGDPTLGGVIPLDNVSSGSWTPTLTGFTIVGSPIITGKFVRNGNTVHCWVLIDTSVGNTVQSIAGTSRISNFPLSLAPTIRSTCTASDEAITSYGVGAVSPADGAYTPSWPAGTDNIFVHFSYYIGA